MENHSEDRWVFDRLATLEPKWHPDLAQARAVLDTKLMPRNRTWTWTAAATAAVCVIALAFPAPRAIAQRLWDRFVLNRIDIVRVDLSRLPLKMRVTTNGLEQGAQDLDDAEQKAGFRPYLPAPGVVSANPVMTVTGPMVVQQTIAVRDVQSALAKVGAREIQVPPEWEGVTLRADVGPIVAANYPDVQILQSRPIELFVPTGFDLERLAEVAFRSIGVSFWEARAMGREFAAQPAWLLDFRADEVVNIQEVALGAGPALLIENLDEKGIVERATVIRSTSERLYSVSSKKRELSVNVANALP
jgi:hypothetical protein